MGSPEPQAAAVAAHEIRPWPDSVYSVDGPNTGQPAAIMNPHHYPVIAICMGEGCGQVIRSETFADTWHHTGLMPGDPR